VDVFRGHGYAARGGRGRQGLASLGARAAVV